MDVLDCLRLRQGQQVVVALQAALARLETISSEMALVEPQILNLRAHSTVENQDAPARGLSKSRPRVLVALEGHIKDRVER